MQREMSKTKAVILISLSGIAAIISALELHGWHVYLAMGLVGIGLVFGFVRWSRKYREKESGTSSKEKNNA